MSSIMACSSPPLASTSMPLTWRGVLSSSVRPERLGQPAGRVDGEHHRAPAVPLGRPQRRARPRWWSCPRRRRRSRRRSGSPGRRGARRRPAAAPRLIGRHQSSVSGRRVRCGRACAQVRVSPPAAGRSAQLVQRRPGRPRRAAAAARPSAGPARPGRRAATPPARAGSGGPAPRVQPGDGGRSAGQPGGGQPAAQLGLGHRPPASSGGRAPLTITRPTGMPQRGQLGDRVDGLLDRHLLQQRHHVHRGHRRAQQRGHALALGLDRAHLGQPGGLRGHVEEPADPAGRRRVQHHRVVRPGGRPTVRVVASLTLPVSSTSRRPGRDGGGEVDRAELAQRPAGRAQLVEHVQVLQQRLLGVHRERAHLAAAGRGRRCAAPRTAAGRGRTAGRCPAGPRPRPAACAGRRAASASASAAATRGLAGAALAGHHVQPGRPSGLAGPIGAQLARLTSSLTGGRSAATSQTQPAGLAAPR